MTDGNGLPLIAITAKANVHDLKLALPTIDRLKIGQRIRRPNRVRADKGYDSVQFRKQLRLRGIKSAVDSRDYPNRKLPVKYWNDGKEIRYGRCRWKVERSFAILDQNRRLDFLYERTRKTYEAFLTIALIRCYLKVLVKSRIKN